MAARVLPNDALQMGLQLDPSTLAGAQAGNLALTIPACNHVQDGNTRYLTTYPWVTTRLTNQVSQAGARFEYSLYGPLLYLLLGQFPPKRHFMIAPQAGFREVVAPVPGQQQPPAQPQQAQTHRRISSHGTEIPQGTTEVPGDQPDFVLNKVTSRVDSDIILCIVEVKRDSKKWGTNENQIHRYLKRAAREKYCVGKLYGFLIEGAQTTIYSINAEQCYTQSIAGQNLPDPTYIGTCTTAVSLKKKLHQISSFFWGNPQNIWLTNAGCAALDVRGD